jgi:hypothetical protein
MGALAASFANSLIENGPTGLMGEEYTTVFAAEAYWAMAGP